MENKQPQEGQIVLAFPVFMAVQIGIHTVKQPVHALKLHAGVIYGVSGVTVE